MPHLMTMSGLALLSALGAAVGTYLGRDTIAQIDPIFFSALPETSYLPDDEPEPFKLGEPAPIPAEHLWWNTLPSRPAENFVEQLYATTSYREQSRAAQRELALLATQIETERPILAPEIERYTSYPITEEEARAPRRTYASEDRAEHELPESSSPDGGAPPVGM